MSTRTIIGTKLQEGETFNYVTTIRDSDGSLVDLTGLDVDVFCSLYVKATGASVNSRLNQQVVTAGVASNEHTVTSAGVLTFKSVVADNPAIAADTTYIIRYTFSFDDAGAVARTGIHEVEYTVEDLTTVS